MRYIWLLALMLPPLSAQDGAAIYKERCAACHDAPKGRIPALSAIKAMSGEAIYVALTTGLMKTQAAGLSTGELFALIGYIAPTGGSHAPSRLHPHMQRRRRLPAGLRLAMEWVEHEPHQLPLPGRDLRRAFSWQRSQTQTQMGVQPGRRHRGALAANYRRRARVHRLPTGAVYSLDADTGCTRWGFQAGAGLRAGVTIGEAKGTSAVFFSDGGGTMYALNAQSGELIWKVKPVDHYTTIATATPRFYKGVVYQPYSSFEEALAGDPKLPVLHVSRQRGCDRCRHRQNPLEDVHHSRRGKPTRPRLRPGRATRPLRRSHLVDPDDRRAARRFCTSQRATTIPIRQPNTSDAILALDLKTGALLWSKQLTENDAFNNGCAAPPGTNCPASAGKDFDFGQPPILVSFGQGKRALVIAQKSGMVHAIDPDEKGKILWQTRAGAGGYLGGSQWGSASDGEKVYVAISDVGIGGVADPKSPQGFRMTLDPKKGGGLLALDLKTGNIVWTAKPTACADSITNCSPAQSAAVTAIPGIVFSGSVDGHLRAYSAATGEIRWDVDTAREFPTVNGKPAHGGAMDAAGPAVVNGMVFVNSGYGQWGGMSGNVFLAFSVDGK